MARPRTFEIEDALEDAMNVFWEKGYDGASLPDLLSGTGLTRGSLYKAFHDKKALFLKALDRYDRTQVETAVEFLTDPAPSRIDRIATVFAGIVENVRAGDRRGCLLCSAAAGPASEDTDIASAVDAMLARMTGAFAVALSRREDAAGIETDTRRNERAAGLTAAYVGMRILSHSGASPETLEMAARATVRGSYA